jgi:hypothetical protein
MFSSSPERVNWDFRKTDHRVSPTLMGVYQIPLVRPFSSIIEINESNEEGRHIEKAALTSLEELGHFEERDYHPKLIHLAYDPDLSGDLNRESLLPFLPERIVFSRVPDLPKFDEKKAGLAEIAGDYREYSPPALSDAIMSALRVSLKKYGLNREEYAVLKRMEKGEMLLRTTGTSDCVYIQSADIALTLKAILSG